MPILEVEMVCDDTRPFEPGWAQGIADILGKPSENVHIIFDVDAVGRIAFGGEFVEGEE